MTAPTPQGPPPPQPQGPQAQYPQQQPYAQPQGYPQPGYMPPQQGFMPPPAPPKRGVPTWVWIVSGVVVVVILGCVGTLIAVGAGANSSAKSISDSTDSKSDVSIVKCGTENSFDSVTGDATVKVTNSGSSKATYLITIAFESKDRKTQYDTTLATVDDLAPGQTTTVDAPGFQTVPTTLTCRVTSIDRF